MVKCWRRQYFEMDTWFDKSIEKHNHDFSIECILESRKRDMLSRVNNYQIIYQKALMCSKCHTFTVSKDYISNRFFEITTKFDEAKGKILSEEQEKLPRIIGISDSKFFNDVQFKEIIFPDGAKYERDK